MREFISFLKPVIDRFIDFMTASQRWNIGYEKNLAQFDKFIVKNYPDKTELTQEMVDRWCEKRSTEQVNTCLSHWCVINRY